MTVYEGTPQLLTYMVVLIPLNENLNKELQITEGHNGNAQG